MDRALVWLKGLLAAAIGGAATSVGVMVADPLSFNFQDGAGRLATVAGVSALVAVASYLKQSPLPDTSQGQLKGP